MSKTDPLEHRKKLTFEQAEAGAPLPKQLKRGEISEEFRAILWDDVYGRLQHCILRDSFGGELLEPWALILRTAWVLRDHKPIDDFPGSPHEIVQQVKLLILFGLWFEVLGWLEFVLKHPACPHDFAEVLNDIMRNTRLAYSVFDGVVICAVGSDAERKSVERAFADLAATEFHGARTHLRKAAEQLNAGHYPDSVRESIHAVEATARVLGSAAALGSALARLEKSAKIHPALKNGFGNLYGYTSDERGIRHPLLDDPAKVDETDALFMIGACAAFVSYLINKARTAGLLASEPTPE